MGVGAEFERRQGTAILARSGHHEYDKSFKVIGLKKEYQATGPLEDTATTQVTARLKCYAPYQYNEVGYNKEEAEVLPETRASRDGEMSWSTWAGKACLTPVPAEGSGVRECEIHVRRLSKPVAEPVTDGCLPLLSFFNPPSLSLWYVERHLAQPHSRCCLTWRRRPSWPSQSHLLEEILPSYSLLPQDLSETTATTPSTMLVRGLTSSGTRTSTSWILSCGKTILEPAMA